MLLPAIVLETKDFASTGKIRVRIASKYFGDMCWNLADNPQTVLDGTGIDESGNEKQSDFFVNVFTPFGVGVNSSMFYLPKVNMIGVVAPMGSIGSREYIWLGGFFRSTASIVSNETEVINIPTDYRSDNEHYGATGGSYLLDDSEGFIWRTRTTRSPPRENIREYGAELFDWTKADTENIIQFNEAKFSVEHIEETNNKNFVSFQKLHMGSNYYTNNLGQKIPDEGFVELKNSGHLRISRVLLDRAKASIEFINGGSERQVSSKLECGNNGIYFSTTIDDKRVVISQGEDGILLSFGETSIIIEKNNVSITAENVTVDANQVRLGNSDQRIVTTTSSLSNFKLADGVILSTSDKVFA